MFARRYQSADAQGVDLLLNSNRTGDVRLNCDELFLVGDIGKPTGVLVYRPGAFVHELQCGRDLLSLKRADALARLAVQHATEREHKLRSAIFLVKADNLAMQRWAERVGAVLQSDPGDLLYVLTP